MKTLQYGKIARLLLLLYCFHSNTIYANSIQADVVVIVDTSISMKDKGMDPDHVSLLVSKLFTDIVPGYLAVIRSPDIDQDKDIMYFVPANTKEKCSEGEFETDCFMFKYKEGITRIDVENSSKEHLLGALIRQTRGDIEYKKKLVKHLKRATMLNDFALSFLSAQGIFEQHEQNNISLEKFIIWLSDGHLNNPLERESLKWVVADLQNTYSVHIEAIVFGNGDTTLAEEMGLPVQKSSSNHELMNAFAGAFRRIVKAPYEIDNLLANSPHFQIKPNVDEAWVVIYGDKTLNSAYLEGPKHQVIADYAQDKWLTAGAYKVAYLQSPPAGPWKVYAEGGGINTAYAVVQRSNLTPSLLQPKTATAGTPTPLVVGIRAGVDGVFLTDLELLQQLTVAVRFQGKKMTLLDNGTNGDKIANDGYYTAMVKFQEVGEVPIDLYLTSQALSVEKVVTETVKVNGLFKYNGGPLHLDLGTFSVTQEPPESCVNLNYTAIHQGQVPFQMKLLRTLPTEHQLEIRGSDGTIIKPDSEIVDLSPTDKRQICLSTSKKAPSSTAKGETWVNLHVANSQAPAHQLELQLKWNVQGLSFWQRWGWLILLILGFFILIFIVLGFILPQRFSGRLALSFVPEYDDLDAHTPQPVKQWQGVGIGFYRNARAFLHTNFKLSGKPQGALVILLANKGGTRVMPVNPVIYRETIDGDWETVPPNGQRIHPGDVYRIGEKGPYFRVKGR